MTLVVAQAKWRENKASAHARVVPCSPSCPLPSDKGAHAAIGLLAIAAIVKSQFTVLL